MGRMQDALRKAAQERERKRRQKAVSEMTPEVLPDGRTTGVAPSAADESRAEQDVFVDRSLGAECPGISTETTTGETLSVGSESGEGAARTTVPGRNGAEETAWEEVPAAVRGRRPPKTAGRLSGSDHEGAPSFTRADLRQGSSPVDGRVVTYHRVLDRRAEQFRVLRTNLGSLAPRPRRILISSGGSHAGKSLVVANLAAAMAEEGNGGVLMVDANLRHPSLHGFFCLRPAPGVSDFLLGAVDNLEPLLQTTAMNGVSLLAAGEQPQNPGALWVSHALRRLLEAVPERFTQVLIDTPSMEDYADASVMAPDADGVLLVVRVAAGAKGQTERALSVLETAQARVLGAFATHAH